MMNSIHSIHSIRHPSEGLVKRPLIVGVSSLNTRVKDLCLRILKSHSLKVLILFSLTVGAVTLLALSHVPVLSALALAIGGLSLLILGIYIPLNRKKILYEVSLFGTLVVKKLRPLFYSWWHPITPNIYLGALPLKNFNHDKKIAQLGVTAVLSLVEEFEFKTKGIFSVPCTTKDWKQLRVKHEILPTADFKPVPLAVLEKGVKRMEELTKEGRVYVHCKAGKGRSATLVLAYLLKQKIVPSIDEGVIYLKKKRPIISIPKGKRRILEQFYQKHCVQR